VKTYFLLLMKPKFPASIARTGPSESNVRIAEAAKAKGFKWHPYKPGFSEEATGRVFPMGSEEEVFRFVSLPYAEPWERQ
jgi:DNA polymerase/3'-5' exonuclease PolX